MNKNQVAALIAELNAMPAGLYSCDANGSACNSYVAQWEVVELVEKRAALAQQAQEPVQADAPRSCPDACRTPEKCCNFGCQKATPPAPQVPAPVDEREVWLPIESAPKDGTRLILWWGGKPVFAGWLDNSQCKHPWAGWQTPSLTPRPQGEPTHYMLLPSAPQTKGGEA